MEEFIETYWWAILVYGIWAITWKGIALWKAGAINHDKIWFIILLLVNTLGVLEIIYIFFMPNQEENSQ